MKYKEKISIVLIICLLLNVTFTSNISVKAQSLQTNKVFYYEGKGYEVKIDIEGTVNISSMESGINSGSITVHKDGTADANIKNNNKNEGYFLDIDKLDKKNINMNVYDKKSKNKINEINNYNDLKYDQYIGQTYASYSVYSLSLLIDILVVLAILVVIAGVVYYCIVDVIDMIRDVATERTKENRPQVYYAAYIQGPQVVIDFPNPISASVAENLLVSGRNTYTYFSQYAQTIALSASKKIPNGNLTGAEIDQNRKDGYIYFYHYHLNRTNPAHSFFGFPYTK